MVRLESIRIAKGMGLRKGERTYLDTALSTEIASPPGDLAALARALGH
jgi:hypothetical protein